MGASSLTRIDCLPVVWEIRTTSNTDREEEELSHVIMGSEFQLDRL
jgi:hypothetical protein